MRFLVLATLGVILVQVCGGVFLYAMRVETQAAWLSSDFIVLLAPVIVGVCMQAYVFWRADVLRHSSVVRVLGMCTWSGVAVAIALYVTLLVAVNRWGA